MDLAASKIDVTGKLVPVTEADIAQAEFDAQNAAGGTHLEVPVSVTDYQFAGQAYAENIIDFDAAKAWTGSGVVPKVLLDAVDAVVSDPERHARVVLFLMGTKDFPRNHELTPILAASFGKDTPEKLDAFFVAAGKR